MNRFSGFLILLATIPLSVDAQSFFSARRDRTLILTLGSGTSTYFGELKPPNITLVPDPSINLNVGLQYYFTNRIAVRTELDWFQLRGSDNNTLNKARNLSFVSSNYEFNATGMVNVFPNGHRFYQRSNINFYGFAGIGLMYMNPKADYMGKRYALQPLRTEGVKYSRFQPVIPYGLGAKIKFGPFINIAIEAGWRLTFTDYLDDVSKVHPDKTDWDPIRIALSDRRQEGNPEFTPAVAGAKRGNPDKNDSYFLLNMKIEYYLPHNFLFKSNSKKLYSKKRRAVYRKRK